MSDSRPRRIAISNYNHKADGLRDILVAAGHQLVDRPPLSSLFIDTDVPWAQGRADRIEWAHRYGARVFIYPHGANPLCDYGGFAKPHPHVTAMLVTSPGHKKLQQSFGHSRKVIEAGWFYCPLRDFGARQPRNVLFAPRHPWADGHSILDRDREANKDAFRRILQLGLPVTVRHLGCPAASGAEAQPGVTLVEGRPDNSYDMIDQHDLVVATGTFAFLAVARGVPTVMFDSDRPYLSDNGAREPVDYSRYSGMFRYPFDLADGDVVDAVCAGSPLVDAWRADWIGEQMTAERLPL